MVWIGDFSFDWCNVRRPSRRRVIQPHTSQNNNLQTITLECSIREDLPGSFAFTTAEECKLSIFLGY